MTRGVLTAAALPALRTISAPSSSVWSVAYAPHPNFEQLEATIAGKARTSTDTLA